MSKHENHPPKGPAANWEIRLSATMAGGDCRIMVKDSRMSRESSGAYVFRDDQGVTAHVPYYGVLSVRRVTGPVDDPGRRESARLVSDSPMMDLSLPPLPAGATDWEIH